MREADISVDDSDFEAMGIGELIAMGRDAGILDFEELECRGTGAVVQVEVASRYDEERLAELECVDTWEYVTETTSGHLYVISFTAPRLPEHLQEEAEDLIGTCDPELDDDRTSLSLVGEQETIANVIEAYESVGIAADLEKLGAYRGKPNLLDDLTGRQREIIETAVDLGFYEVPREASVDDLAAELNLDPSTVAEHLQRAERNVFNELL